jgi:hypothetical protein
MTDIPKVKRNIQRMIDMGAPETDIDAYIGSEGVSLDMLQSKPQEIEGPPVPSPEAQAQSQFDQLPTWQKPLKAVEDIARLGMDGLTYGFGDKIGAKGAELLGQGTYDENLGKLRQETEAARSRSGIPGMAAEIGGQIAGPAKLAGALKAVPGVGAISGIRGAKTAGAVAGGAGLGALDAAGHDTDIGTGAAIGGAAGLAGRAIAPGVGAAAGKVGRALGINKAPQIMTREQIKEASEAAYKASDDAGVIIKPQAVQRFAKEVQEDLAEFGYMPELQPKVAAVLKRLGAMSEDNNTLKGIDQLRKAVGMLGGSENRSEGAVGRQITKKIDKFLESMDAEDILAGNKTQGVMALQQARKLWASQRKSEMLEEALENAKLNANKSGSGGNIDNAIRQQFASILKSKKKSRGLTRDERAAMQLIVNGVRGEKLLRAVSKMSPNGNGLMTWLQGGGAVATGGATLPLAGAGIAAKLVQDAITPARIGQLDKIVRGGGNASAVRSAPNAAQRLTQAQGPALIRSLGIAGARPDEPPPY